MKNKNEYRLTIKEFPNIEFSQKYEENNYEMIEGGHK